jgi:Co/Zn/Cd efflux system component/copper chaperone CopZ
MDARSRTVRYRVYGLDCPTCATRITAALDEVPGITQARVSIATAELTLCVDVSQVRFEMLEQAVATIGYRLERLDIPNGSVDGDDHDIPDLSHATPGYRRALWIVVMLNVVYGVIEIAGGFWAESQAVKADALDFIGDGFISLLGLAAIGWPLVWRARAAMMQGIFLAFLGIGVLAATIYRVFVQHVPQAEVMGSFGVVALVINVICAAVLLPHRAGDSNVRAVWLFSRNDAIGNLAVIGAAALVAWTASPWPDLIVAFVVAALFLQSAKSIVRDALGELKRAA